MISCSQCQSQNTELDRCKSLYYELLANDLLEDDFLVSVSGIFVRDTIDVVISNYELYNLCLEMDGNPKDRMTKILIGGEYLKIDNLTIDEFQVVHEWTHLDEIYVKGQNAVLESFFRDGRFQNGYLSTTESVYLIDKLYDWCYLMYFDDETGYLVITTVDKMVERISNFPKRK